MRPKRRSLKSTNQQPFGTNNYVTLSFPLHLKMSRSEIQRLIKRLNIKLIFNIFSPHIILIRRNQIIYADTHIRKAD